jgi:hypothetical protein
MNATNGSPSAPTLVWATASRRPAPHFALEEHSASQAELRYAEDLHLHVRIAILVGVPNMEVEIAAGVGDIGEYIGRLSVPHLNRKDVSCIRGRTLEMDEPPYGEIVRAVGSGHHIPHLRKN